MKNKNDWHLLSAAQVLSAFSTDMYKGLTEREAAKRRAKYGKNSIWQIKKISAAAAVYRSVLDIATILLIISAASAALFDKSREALTVTVILLIGGLLRATVYIRASRILESNAAGMIPTASVIRDGKLKLIPATELVPGDIIFLESGCTVPCDGRVIAGDDSVVSERGITENATFVHKFNTTIETSADSGEVPCEYRSNMLFAGAIVLSGRLRMVATACGKRSLIGMKQGGITIEPSDKLPIIEKLKNWCKFTGLIMLASVMLLTGLSLAFGDGYTLPDIFLGTLAMAVAAMSEYLTVIGYIIIAVSVHGCASKCGAVIRKPSEIEALASIDRIIFCGSSFFESGNADICAYYVNGRLYNPDTSESDNSGLKRLVTLMSAAAAINEGKSIAGADGIAALDSEVLSTIQTVRNLFAEKVGSLPVLDHVDSTNAFAGGLDTSLVMLEDKVTAVSCGDVSSVLRACSSYLNGNEVCPIDEAIRREIFTECAKLEFKGAKIAAAAYRESEYTTLSRLAVITTDMVFAGFAAVSERPERNADKSVQLLSDHGIEAIIISDNAEHDLYYCHDIGLTDKKTTIVTPEELDGVKNKDFSSGGLIVARKADTNGASSPNRKQDIVKLLKRDDKVTAVFGRDISDTEALRQADISFVAAKSAIRPIPEPLSREAAVVTASENPGHGGLHSMTGAISAAIQAIKNIKSAAFYITASQTARFIIILSSILFDLPFLDDVAILSWGLLYDFAAILVMAFEYEKTNRREDCVIADGKGRLPISIWQSFALGLMWGVINAASIIPARLLAPLMKIQLTEGGEISLLAGGIILSALVMSCEIMKTGSLLKRTRLNYAFFCFAVFSVFLAAVTMLTKVGADFIGGEPCMKAAPFALIPSVIVFAVWELIKLIHRKRKQNPQVTEE